MFEKNTEKYQKHCKVGLKNTKYNIMWVPKTYNMQFGVFIKTLLFSVHACAGGIMDYYDKTALILPCLSASACVAQWIARRSQDMEIVSSSPP